MRNIYKAITIPTAQSNLCIYNKDGKPEYLVSENQFIRYGEFHPQYLVIAIDERPKFGEWCYSVRGWIGKFGEHENSYPEECKKIIASNHPSINNITLSDLKYYVELGCPDMISLEMEDKVKSRIEHSCKKMRCDCNNKEYCSSNSSKVVDYSIPQLKLIDSCVVFAREETTGQKLDRLSKGQSSKWSENADKRMRERTPETNVGKMEESELDKAVNKFMDEMPIFDGVYQGTGRFSENSIEDAFYHGAQWQKQQHPKPVEGVMSAEDYLAGRGYNPIYIAESREAATKYAKYVLSMSGRWTDEDMEEAYDFHKERRYGDNYTSFNNFLTQYKTSKL